MKKYNIAVLAFLSLISFLSCKNGEKMVANKEAEQKAEKPAMAQSEKSLLWEISGNGLAQSSFLFGTIHMIDAEDYFLPEGTLSAIDQSKDLIFEIDMADMNDVSKLMPMLQKAYMKDNLTLEDVMSAEDYKVVEDHFKKMNMPMFFFKRIKPMFLSVFAMDINPNDLKNGAMKSYEMEFHKIAEEAGKGTGGLETIDYQISIFDSIPYKEQATMLVEAIKAGADGAGQFDELVQIYKDQDVEGLYKAMQGDESLSGHEDVLLNNRNKNWIVLMKDQMKDQRLFYAVGAGHLGGPEGVISLLRKEGYTVTPYKG